MSQGGDSKKYAIKYKTLTRNHTFLFRADLTEEVDAWSDIN